MPSSSPRADKHPSTPPRPTFSTFLKLPSLPPPPLRPKLYGATRMTSTTPPRRFLLVFHCFLSFIICNMDRINLSVAIIPMSQTFSWSSSTKGLVQSVFFAGYMTTQILGGILADAYGGRIVLAMGVLLWSICTMTTPAAAHISFPLLLVIRIALGVGEGVAMPAMNAIVATSVPVEQRARSLSSIYSGMYAGSILGLVFSPVLMARGGWPMVFYIFGATGIVWVIVFVASTRGTTSTDYETVPDVEANAEGDQNDSSAEQQPETLKPSLREMFSKRCVWAIIIAHFCCTWGYFVLLTWLPTYLYSQFNLNVRSSALLSTLPWLSMFVFANVGGQIADFLIRRSVPVTFTRKLMQSIGFIGPAIFLAILCTARSANEAMAYVSAGLALASFSQSGVYANHQDIGPGVAGTLLGISNTFASLPGLIGVYVSGVVLDLTGGNWNAVFGMAIAFYAVGVVAYNTMGTSERQW